MRSLVLAALATGMLATACGTPATPTKALPTSSGDPGVNVRPAFTEALVGPNRFTFGLLTNAGGLIQGARAHVKFYKVGAGGKDELRAEADAAFRTIEGATPHAHPDRQLHAHIETSSAYVVEDVRFDSPGIWQAQVEIVGRQPGANGLPSLAFEVTEKSATVMVGQAPPATSNPTVRDVKTDLSEITTHASKIAGLYQLTVAEALQQHKPFVVVFATPQFCVSRMCGPVTDVVIQVYDKYKDRVNFIHIEPWRLDAARNEGKLVPVDAFTQWNLPSEPWVFVVGADGRVSARFEGFFTAEELSKTVDAVAKG